MVVAAGPYVRDDNYSVLGEMDIRLNGMCSNFHGSLKCSHCVLWMRRLVPSMGDGLRKSTARC